MKSILVHVNDDAGQESRLQAAFDLARAFDAHLTCLHATPYEDYLATDPFIASALPTEFSRTMERKREEMRDGVEARLRSEGMSWDWLHVDELMSTALIRASAFADLVVLSLSPDPRRDEDPRPLAGTVATATRTPVLAVPASLKALDLSAPSLLAWNGSAEAAAVLHGGLPLLRRASRAILLQVEERQPVFPATGAARYLSRHGVEAEILERGPIDGSVSKAIEQAALETGAAMVLMGAYGRSRLREMVLGGVTRELLSRSRVPLVLAH